MRLTAPSGARSAASLRTACTSTGKRRVRRSSRPSRFSVARCIADFSNPFTCAALSAPSRHLLAVHCAARALRRAAHEPASACVRLHRQRLLLGRRVRDQIRRTDARAKAVQGNALTGSADLHARERTRACVREGVRHARLGASLVCFVSFCPQPLEPSGPMLRSVDFPCSSSSSHYHCLP